MRLILLLLVLVIIGFTVVQQLTHKPPESALQQDSSGEIATPIVPTRPQDIETFSQDMNQFMQDAAQQRSSEIDDVTK